MVDGLSHALGGRPQVNLIINLKMAKKTQICVNCGYMQSDSTVSKRLVV